MIYLDHAASMPLKQEAYQHLLVTLKEDFANPSAQHALGQALAARIEAARRQFLAWLQAEEGYRFCFTSSATESNNTAIFSWPLVAGDGLIYSPADHASIVQPVNRWIENGIRGLALPLNSVGDVDQEALCAMLSDEVKALILTEVNSQSGHRYDVIAIAKAVKAHCPRIRIHVDAVQSFAKWNLSLADGVIDSLSISAHKIGGPKGISGLYCANTMALKPLLLGGNQELGLRSSTQALSLIEAFKAAAAVCFSHQRRYAEHVQRLNQGLRCRLAAQLPELVFPFATAQQLSPYILLMFIPGLASDVIVRHLEQQDIFISSRSACSSKKKGPIPAFSALGIPEKWHQNSIRASFSELTTREELDQFSESLVETVRELNQLIRR